MLPTMTELDQAQERHEAYATEAIRGHRAATRTSAIRRAIGVRFIALGRRIAAEPVLELARSR